MSKLEMQILDAFSSLARTLQDMALILLAKCPLHVGTPLQKPSKQTSVSRHQLKKNTK